MCNAYLAFRQVFAVRKIGTTHTVSLLQHLRVPALRTLDSRSCDNARSIPSGIPGTGCKCNDSYSEGSEDVLQHIFGAILLISGE